MVSFSQLPAWNSSVFAFTWSRISVDWSAPWWKISIISFRNLTPLFWTWGRGWQGHTGRRAQILGRVKKSENMISAKSDCTPMGQKCGLCDSVLVNIGFRFRVTWGDRYHTRFCVGHNTMPKKNEIKYNNLKKKHTPFEFCFCFVFLWISRKTERQN